MQDEKQELMKRSAELEEMSCLDRARLVLDLEAQVKSLSDILARQENEIAEKEEEIVQISDKPTDDMKHWLEKKESKRSEELKKIKEITAFLTGAVKKFGRCDISDGAELDFNCTHEVFNKAVRHMTKNGYVATWLKNDKGTIVGKILRKEVPHEEHGL